MKNLIVVLIMIIAVQVSLNAIPDKNVDYVCSYVPAPVLENSNQEIVPKMIQMCKPMKQYEPISSSRMENSESLLPTIGPVKSLFPIKVFQKLSR